MKLESIKIAEGRLTVGRFKDAAGRPEMAFVLRLPVSGCLGGADKDDERVESTRAVASRRRSVAIQPRVAGCRIYNLRCRKTTIIMIHDHEQSKI